MRYIPWLCVGFTVLLAAILLLCILPKRKSYERDLAEYKKSLYYRGTRNNYNMVASDPGLYGEYLVSRILEPHEQDARFLYNLYIPYGKKTTEIDMLMIHPMGVFVIESKNFSGKIAGDVNEQTWTQHVAGHTETLYNPIKQNNTHVYALRQHIGQNVNLHPIVVFGNRCKLKIRGKSEHPVLQIQQLDAHVRRILKYGYKPMTKTKVNALYKQLKPYTQVSEEQKAEHAIGIERAVCVCPACRIKFPTFTEYLHRGAKFEVICPECHQRIMMRKED